MKGISVIKYFVKLYFNKTEKMFEIHYDLEKWLIKVGTYIFMELKYSK